MLGAQGKLVLYQNCSIRLFLHMYEISVNVSLYSLCISLAPMKLMWYLLRTCNLLDTFVTLTYFVLNAFFFNFEVGHLNFLQSVKSRKYIIMF